MLSLAGCEFSSSPLHLAAGRGDVPAIKKALANGRSPDARAHGERTALQVAIIDGQLESARTLLDAGASPNGIDARGDSPLMFATRRDRGAFIPLLLRYKPNVNLQNGRGATALHFAAVRSEPDVIRQLLAAGADPKLRDSNGRTAADVATDAATRAALPASTLTAKRPTV